ncbi:MAG: DUF222 domain-containing protein [Acidimicrobiia bacterium]|nr:DUF222 domain-containing protein [Acidimicrobiia bacterium]
METKTRTPADLTDEMDAWHAANNASLVNLLDLVAEYDRAELWVADGATSMAAWLTFQYGLTPRTANDWVEIATALLELPALRAEFAEGRLSFDQIKFACRLATPETDQDWASEAGKHSASRLEAMARRKRAITAAESNDAHRRRSHRMRWDTDHRMLFYRGCLPEEQGAILESAINRLADQMGKDPLTGVYDTFDVKAADALVQLASQSLGADSDPDRATVVVHVSAEALTTGVGSGEVENGPGLSIDTVRRLGCDGRVEVVAESSEGIAIGIGRARRIIPSWMARNLMRRDQGCQFPGCHHRRWVHGHHIRFWSEGGPTDLDNLIMLCPRHHRMLHEQGWRIEGDPNGNITWIRPDGRVFASRAGP